MLDEPLGALDKKLRNEMQLELKRLQSEFGITFIIVTHDQEEALVMADRIAIMQNGSLLQVGTPHEIYEAPDTRFAANFIGVMNFLPVTKTGGDFTMANGTKVLATRINGAVPDGDAVAAVRPERLVIDDSGDNILRGQITAIAYHGLDLLLHIKTDFIDTPIIARMTADLAETHRPNEGQQITISWSAKDTHIFPA